MRKPYVIMELLDQRNLLSIDEEGIVYSLDSKSRVTTFLLCSEEQAKDKARQQAANNPHKLFALMSPIYVAEVVRVPVIDKEFNEAGELVIKKTT